MIAPFAAGAGRSLGGRGIETDLTPAQGVFCIGHTVGVAWEVYAFNPLHSAILLIGGDKTGDGRWYEKFVPIADRLFDRHLLDLKNEGSI
jgi:hypothetical protein